MPPETLLETVRHQPFQPFRLYVTDGAVYDIKHPEMILPGRRAIVVGLPGEPNHPYENFVTIALIHVTRLEPLQSVAVSGNGA